MERKIIFFVLILWNISVIACEQIPLTSWKFHFGDVPNAVRPDFDDNDWEQIRVPHDWAIDKAFDMRIDMQSVQVLEDGDKVPRIRTGRTGALPAFGIGYYRTDIMSNASMAEEVLCSSISINSYPRARPVSRSLTSFTETTGP